MSGSNTLKRSVGLYGAILLGLGSILGTGVFVSLGLAVGVAGHWAIPALLLASLLAACNALSSAQLAANHPVSGGTYAYGYHYLTPMFGFVAGVCFLLAKSASAAAASLGVAGYMASFFGWSEVPVNLIAAGAVLVMTALTAFGLKRASAVNTVLVLVTIASLVILVTAAGVSPQERSGDFEWPRFVPARLFEAAALLFVAFTGYGRIATLGEEVKEPRRTIPKAIITTLLVSTGLYFAVLYTGLSVLGAERFADVTVGTAAPLQAVAAQLERPMVGICIAMGAFTAMAGVLLNLLLGLSRVAFAMGRKGDLPSGLARMSVQNEPVIAVWAVGLFIAFIALSGGIAAIWSFSAFTVLVYYAITNLAALRLEPSARLYPRLVSICGLLGCIGLAIWIESYVAAAGAVTLLISILLRKLIRPRTG